MRSWADEVSVGLDTGVRISLRIEMAESLAFSAVVQLHSLKDPTLVGTRTTSGPRTSPGSGRGLGSTRRWRSAGPPASGRRSAGCWTPPYRIGWSWPTRRSRELLAGRAQRLAAAGVDLHWPRSLGRALTARAAITSSDGPPSDLPSFFGGDATLDFSWQVALGRRAPLTEAELDQLAEATRPVVRLRDQWMLIDPDLARKARERILKPVTRDRRPRRRAHRHHRDRRPPGRGRRRPRWLDDLRARIADPDRADEPIDAPAGLQATLRDYQLRGLRWLARMTSLGLGGCLADDMGLGKTITLIALHLHRQQSPDTAGPTLVVCPASLLGNWEREIQRFAPGTPVRRFHGSARSLDGADDGFVLTTYGTMRRDAVRLAEHRWALRRRRRGAAREEPVVRYGEGAADRPGAGAGRADRHPGREQPVRAVGDPRLDHAGAARAARARSGAAGRRRSRRTRTRRSRERLAKLVRPFLLRRRKSDPGHRAGAAAEDRDRPAGRRSPASRPCSTRRPSAS